MPLIELASLKKLYLSEVGEEIVRHPSPAGGIISDEDISPLPEPVQRYFRFCGYVGRPRMINARIDWGNVMYRRSSKHGWMRLSCLQFNSVPSPSRIVYMKANLLGLPSFEGRDKYQDGRGHMFMKLLKCLRFIDARGPEMDASALVTVLAETFLVPAYALQEYMRWEAIDANTARATLRFSEQEVSGIFHFTEDGELSGFDTEDRYYSETGKDYIKKRWSVQASDYREKNGIRFPTGMKAAWQDANGDYTYFDGEIVNVEYDVKGP